MKKLCTYLTLFVLGLLALAQPAAAANFVAGTTYYIDASDYTDVTVSKITVWDGQPDTPDRDATHVSGNIYSWTQTVDGYTGQVWIKANGDGNHQFGVNAPEGTNNCVKLANGTGNSNYSWTTYGSQGSGDATDYVFYVKVDYSEWGDDCYIYTYNHDGYNWSSALDKQFTKYTEKLSDGVYKFVISNQTSKGNMIFVNKGEWDNPKQTNDIKGANVVNGGLYYTITGNKEGGNETPTTGYQEPATTQKPVLTANPASGEFETSVSVTLSATPACDIFYTTNGDEPSDASSKYSSALTFNANTTLKAVAILNGVSSDVITRTYTKKQAGVYTGKLWVKGPAYTGDAGSWDFKDLENENGIFKFEIKSVETSGSQAGQFVISTANNADDAGVMHIEGQSGVKAISTDKQTIITPEKHNRGENLVAPAGALHCMVFIDMNDHKIWYEPKPVVTADPASCTFYGSQEVKLSADKEGAKIYYTTDGITEPSESKGTVYSAPLTFNETTTLKAVAILNGVSSEVLSEKYTKGTPSVAVTPSSTTFDTTLDVTITATPSGAKIYYTTDGTEPSTDGTSYDSPVKFTISSTTTVKAIAVINGVQSEKQEGTFTKVKYSGSLYAKGPAFQGNWGDFTLLSGSNGVFSFDVKSADEFAISSSTENSGIYMPVGIPTNDETSFPFTVPTGEDNAKAIHKNFVYGKNFKAPAANGKIFIDMNDLKIWYEPKSFSNTKLYIRAAFISDTDWGKPEWNKEMTWNESEGVYVWDATSARTGDQFMISWNTDMWKHKFACDPIPTEKPSTSNVNDDNGSDGSDLKLPKPGYIKYDPVNKILWVGPKQAVPPTLYTFYVKIDDSYASAWGEDKCYLYTFDEGDDKWTSINGQCVKYDRRLADGVYKFVVRGQSSKGCMLFKNTWGTSKEEYSGTILPADIKPGALYTISAKDGFTVAPEEYVESKVFEAGKAYYVDASAVAKDGTNWFENDDCTLGVKYDGHVHFGGTIVKVSSDPLVYCFTVNEDQTKIEVGRRNDQGLHDAVTVQAPIDGSNCIFLDGSSDELVLDHLGTYSPASSLYILGSSDAIEVDWKNATPIAMNYDATKDVFYYMVQGTNASADHPIEFLISRGASNADFFKAENAFMPVHDGYIHMAEPSYMKGKPGYTDGNYFKLISRGRVMAKYIKAEDSKEITGLKIWYEPVVWPDMYALGSIIAKPGDKKSELGDQTSQWHTFVKLEKDEKQDGLYYYDLGCGDKETKDLFNKEDYEAEGVFGKINEIGHFNFSFLSGTVTGEFWKDAFVPAVGQGMGTLNRDGVPVPFQYRDSDPGRYEREGGWTSTNFVFGERCRIWVDVVRQIVWVQPIVELSDNQVVFDFWDKGGKKYSDGNKYKWWSTTDKATRFAQVYIKDATLPEGTTLPAAYRITAEDLSWMSEELENGEAAGARYHFVASLPTDFFEADGKTVIGGGHLWVRIKNGDSGSHEMLRPYAYQATYTQGPESDPDFNKYGNIKAAGDPIVTIEPSVNMIYADVEAPEHLGLFRESHVMHYPYVNQYSTAVTVNPGNVYPFWVEGLTEPTEITIDGNPVTAYRPVADAPFTFDKSNKVTVSYGSIRETKYGTTGMAVIKGIDHANAAATDKMEVTVTYTSPGLIFARTKTEPLKIDANELPTMRPYVTDETNKDADLIAGFDMVGFKSGTPCSEGSAVDLILHQKFEFRDIMTKGGVLDGKTYVPRAAYIGYEVKIDNPNDHSHVAEGHKHMAKNGVPLMWDFTDDRNRNIKGFTDLDKWHYEAFTGKSMAIQLHHVVCGETDAELANRSVTGTVTFHLYVPVATEFAFETGTTSLVRGMHKAGEQVNSSVLGDPNHPYTGSVSAKSCDTFKHEFTFNTNGNITTGVEGVGVEDAPVEFYNLQGVRMTSETLAPGIYIRRQGNETSKVYIR